MIPEMPKNKIKRKQYRFSEFVTAEKLIFFFVGVLFSGILSPLIVNFVQNSIENRFKVAIECTLPSFEGEHGLFGNPNVSIDPKNISFDSLCIIVNEGASSASIVKIESGLMTNQNTNPKPVPKIVILPLQFVRYQEDNSKFVGKTLQPGELIALYVKVGFPIIQNAELYEQAQKCYEEVKTLIEMDNCLTNKNYVLTNYLKKGVEQFGYPVNWIGVQVTNSNNKTEIGRVDLAGLWEIDDAGQKIKKIDYNQTLIKK